MTPTPEALARASQVLTGWPIDCGCDGVFCDHGHTHFAIALDAFAAERERATWEAAAKIAETTFSEGNWSSHYVGAGGKIAWLLRARAAAQLAIPRPVEPADCPVPASRLGHVGRGMFAPESGDLAPKREPPSGCVGRGDAVSLPRTMMTTEGTGQTDSAPESPVVIYQWANEKSAHGMATPRHLESLGFVCVRRHPNYPLSILYKKVIK
jgi:hypothetical protein